MQHVPLKQRGISRNSTKYCSRLGFPFGHGTGVCANERAGGGIRPVIDLGSSCRTLVKTVFEMSKMHELSEVQS